MTDHADIVREALRTPSTPCGDCTHDHLAALDALVAERVEAYDALYAMRERAEVAEADRDEARRLLTLMRKRKGDFELPNYWKGEIDAALGEDA